MNRERLLKLANHLDTVKPAKFDMGNWSCGTTACAAGHACGIPEFVELGLYLDYSARPDRGCVRFHDGEYIHSGWNAVEDFFGLEPDEAVYLFGVNDYEWDNRTDPKVVAQRLRLFSLFGPMFCMAGKVA